MFKRLFRGMQFLGRYHNVLVDAVKGLTTPKAAVNDQTIQYENGDSITFNRDGNGNIESVNIKVKETSEHARFESTDGKTYKTDFISYCEPAAGVQVLDQAGNLVDQSEYQIKTNGEIVFVDSVVAREFVSVSGLVYTIEKTLNVGRHENGKITSFDGHVFDPLLLQEVNQLRSDKLNVGDFGIGGQAVTLSSKTDLNMIDKTGFYTGYDLTNRPPGLTSWTGIVQHIERSGGSAVQMYHTVTSDYDFFFRRRNEDGTWTAWQKLRTDEDHQVFESSLNDRLDQKDQEQQAFEAAVGDALDQKLDLGYNGISGTAVKLANGSDLNLIRETGNFEGYDLANRPSGLTGWTGFVQHFEREEGSVQVYHTVTQEYHVFYRRRGQNGWSLWKRVATTDVEPEAATSTNGTFLALENGENIATKEAIEEETNNGTLDE